MDDVNEIRLVGRVSGEPLVRELPSGDEVVTFRLVVRRDGKRRPGAPTCDTLDVACWSASSRRTARALADQQVVELSGALRRRFWRTPGGPASRYEVEASSLRARKGAVVSS
ncbi:single-stranded DNA-binding protein [Metallococcus carri]|uniref:single-stranded DNA-binding protein n=1 Tax=Metallococcus carri TaxID=1656884 RepID=UPI002E281DDF|nr:single-stranded DNA-binding protein [Metallococcus carri]